MLRKNLVRLFVQWGLRPEICVPKTDLYQRRIDASKLSISFFILLVSSAAIATLGLISNSTAVVIGAMIVAPLMDPILSLSFGLATSDGMLIRRSATTVFIGICIVILTSICISLPLGITLVQSEIYARTSPNLIDLGIAAAAAVAGAFSMTRERLSSSIAGVAIAVALVPPLCVSGIGLTLGEEATAMFGSGTVAGLTNRIASGSFLLFLVNLIGITFVGLFIFLIHGYGSLKHSWKNVLISLGFVGLISIPLSGALRDFSIAHNLRAEFREMKAAKIRHLKELEIDSSLWGYVRVIYSNFQVNRNRGTFKIVLSVPDSLNKTEILAPIYLGLKQRANDLGLEEFDVNISVIPNRVFRYGLETENLKSTP